MQNDQKKVLKEVTPSIENMIVPRGSKMVSVERINISQHIEKGLKKSFSQRPPLWRNMDTLSEESIKLAIFQAPPIVFEQQVTYGQSQYICVGNFRSFELAHRLSGSQKVRVNVIQPPLKDNIASISALLVMSADLALSMDPKKSGYYLTELISHLLSLDDGLLGLVSQECRFKNSFANAINVSRKKY